MLKKCLDVSKITDLGFKPLITLDDGIKRTIMEYENIKLNYRAN
jgi:nucleoside-diphosphate-sugar epimerase